MNYKSVVNVIGFILIFLGLSMAFSVGWSVYYKDVDLNFSRDCIALLKAMGTTVLSGLILVLGTYSKKKKKELSIRDGFAIVALGWLFVAGFSALPFYFSSEISYVNSFFEAMSGLTTTGASILGSSTIWIEDISHGIQFWRSFTHFIGGMGIIVFSIAILPLLGIAGVQLFKAEVAGPTADKLTPRIKQTAKYLWGIYLGLILIETLILYIEGRVLGIEKMELFDALCHSFGTMATGGFSTYNNSIQAFGHPVINWTIIIFMFLAATNFTLHFLFLIKGSFDYLKNYEFKVYLKLVFFISIFFFFSLYKSGHATELLQTIENSVFYTVSLLTTTGFGTVDYMDWDQSTHTMIFILLFIGGCAGSTTGGIKLIRTLLVFKYLKSVVRKLIHPNGVYPIRMGTKEIPENIVKSVAGFYLFYILIFIGLALFISLTSLGTDFQTAISASASAIGNIGPGLGKIGPYDNWAHFSDLTKYIISFCMLLGRLEIFTVIILFSKTYWKR